MYGRWEVIGVERGKKGLEWICRCECGKEKRQKIWNVRSGRSVMCKECSGRLRRKEKSSGRDRSGDSRSDDSRAE